VGREMTKRNVRWGRPPQPPIPVGAIAVLDLAMPINRLLRRLEFEQGSSSHTVAASRRDLWAFLTFLGQHGHIFLIDIGSASCRVQRRGLLPCSGVSFSSLRARTSPTTLSS
jgi:site-specific recombinase XerC